MITIILFGILVLWLLIADPVSNPNTNEINITDEDDSPYNTFNDY